MDMAAARLGCERAMLGAWWANSHSGYMNRLRKMLFSPFRGFIFGREGCFGSEWVFTN